MGKKDHKKRGRKRKSKEREEAREQKERKEYKEDKSGDEVQAKRRTSSPNSENYQNTLVHSDGEGGSTSGSKKKRMRKFQVKEYLK